jgi:hypothetical protein
MIIQDTIEEGRKATISTSNFGSIGAFRIKESAKAFSILSSSLYQNPIRSIIRELGCNARDAHVAAKNPEPWVLSLPSSLSPEFAVKDNGTGLSHEEVMQIYTTYFESTKTNSNDFVGALGLGSKSPFSYTDNFTVTSVKDGIKNIYSTFLTEEQIPSIVLLDSSNTNEPNGVEVRFSVKSGDFNTFRVEAIEALKFFDQKPKGYPNEVSNQFEIINGIEHVASTKKTYNSSASPLVIMGGVQYTFDTKNPAFEKYSTVINTSHYHMLIRANIGDVDIQPSRESLTMTKKTIEYICSKFDEALKKIKDDIDAKINSEKIEWDRIVLREQMMSSGTEYERRFVKSLGYAKFSIPAKYSGRRYASNVHRKNPGKADKFIGLTDQKISDSIVFVINDNKQTMLDIHACVRTRKKIRSYTTIIEFEPKAGISSEDLQKEIAQYTKGYVPELTSELCSSINSKKKIIGIVYEIARNNKTSSTYGWGFRRSSQENFVAGSHFVELDRENNVVDVNGVVVKDFWEKFDMNQDCGHSKNVFAIKHNSKFDRNLYKRFLDVVDIENLSYVKNLTSDQFFSPIYSASYESRQALISPLFKKFVSQLKDPVAEVVLKVNPHAKSISTLNTYEKLYPGSTKDIVANIDKFHKEFDEFNKRYEPLYVFLHRNQRSFDDLVEFANWRHETKFANK